MDQLISAIAIDEKIENTLFWIDDPIFGHLVLGVEFELFQAILLAMEGECFNDHLRNLPHHAGHNTKHFDTPRINGFHRGICGLEAYAIGLREPVF